MMRILRLLQVPAGDEELCGLFESLMLQYTEELEEYGSKPGRSLGKGKSHPDSGMLPL